MVAILRHPPAPFIAPVSGSIDQRLADIANAINQKASATVPTAFHFLGIISPNGTTWKVTVDNTGVLHTEAVTR